jgi:integration host factor subunit alpha
MRVNLTKKDIINSVYMQIGFSKKIADNLFDDILESIIESLIEHKKVKISKFGTFSIRQKKSRIGRNPKTKETKTISSRDVVLFKPSKEFKEFINLKNNG